MYPFGLEVLSGYMPRSWSARLYGNSMFSFLRNFHTIFQRGCTNLNSEKAMAPHSSTLDWKIPWMEEPGRRSPRDCKESDTTEWLHFHFSLSCTGEGNGNPLQCSCLENPMDGRAWWAAVYGVAQSRSRLKQISSSSNLHSHQQCRKVLFFSTSSPAFVVYSF